MKHIVLKSFVGNYVRCAVIQHRSIHGWNVEWLVPLVYSRTPWLRLFWSAATFKIPRFHPTLNRGVGKGTRHRHPWISQRKPHRLLDNTSCKTIRWSTTVAQITLLLRGIVSVVFQLRTLIGRVVMETLQSHVLGPTQRPTLHPGLSHVTGETRGQVSLWSSFNAEKKLLFSNVKC